MTMSFETMESNQKRCNILLPCIFSQGNTFYRKNSNDSSCFLCSFSDWRNPWFVIRAWDYWWCLNYYSCKQIHKKTYSRARADGNKQKNHWCWWSAFLKKIKMYIHNPDNEVACPYYRCTTTHSTTE